MAEPSRDFIAGGYFLSRHSGQSDCTGIKLSRYTLGQDHTSRVFFPDAWCLSWVNEAREDRLERASWFGFETERELQQIHAWADQSFGKTFGQWNVIYSLESAYSLLETFLHANDDLELLGIGIHRDRRDQFIRETTPPDPQPGYSPFGAGGVHEAVARYPDDLAGGGEPLGYDVLLIDRFGSLNSVESLHLRTEGLLATAGVTLNSHSLLSSHAQASRLADDLRAGGHEPDPWQPWKVVKYPLEWPASEQVS